MIRQNFFLNVFLIAFATVEGAEITCPALSKVPVGTYIPASCDSDPVPRFTSCMLVCPSGYHISYSSVDIPSDTRTCLADGTWEYRETEPTCKDHEAPTLTCPDPTTMVETCKGKGTATTSWKFSFTDNSLIEGEPGITEDSFQVILAINGVEMDTSLPKILPIGNNALKYDVTDPAGNSASCSFIIEVVDKEPPVITDCPADIVVDNATTFNMRVIWQEPTATDNSGVQPTLIPNIQSGELFAVPGSYEIQYKATDDAGNEATCSFQITLKLKECPMYAAPKNGALACNKIGPDNVCAVMCNSPNDFVFYPPLLYYCSSGQWNFYAFPGQIYSSDLPWPDCSATANPSYLKLHWSQYFFYDGDANDPNVQDAMKTKFINFMNSGFVPPIFCLMKPAECNTNTAEVHAGVSTA